MSGPMRVHTFSRRGRMTDLGRSSDLQAQGSCSPRMRFLDCSTEAGSVSIPLPAVDHASLLRLRDLRVVALRPIELDPRFCDRHLASASRATGKPSCFSKMARPSKRSPRPVAPRPDVAGLIQRHIMDK